ncbi:MAG: helix-turn-helix domain-containing protein [Novosphingobium sp.]
MDEADPVISVAHWDRAGAGRLMLGKKPVNSPARPIKGPHRERRDTAMAIKSSDFARSTVHATAAEGVEALNDKNFSDFTSFRNAMCARHLDWELEAANPGEYQARMRAHDHYGVVFTDLRFEKMRGYRSDNQIVNSRDAFYVLLFFLEGGEYISQDEGVTLTRSGDIFLWDTSRPLSFESIEVTRCLSTFFPTWMVNQIAPHLQNLSGRRLSGDDELGAILGNHISVIHDTIDSAPENARPNLLRATLHLAGACFQPASGHSQTTLYQKKLVARIEKHIRENLLDVDFGAEACAEAFWISSRYMRRIMKNAGTSFTAFVTEERLSRATEALVNPLLADESITQIAYRFGFCDSAYFSRLFTKRHGKNPRDFRASHIAGPH